MDVDKLSNAGAHVAGSEHRVSVVVLTHNRIEELLRSLHHLFRLPERPAIVVVDNASSDNTANVVARRYPQVTLISASHNMGAAARNIGVQQVDTPYVAFCDDDSWWARGSLTMAADILDGYPKVAGLCGRVLLGNACNEDPFCADLAASPLPSEGLPGRAVLGFAACAVVFRRQAFLDAGGYEERFFVGGEEELLSLDLAASGWSIAYAPQLTVHHHPSPRRDSAARQKIVIRNALWVAWLRLPISNAWQETGRLWGSAPSQQVWLGALLKALREVPWIWRARKVLPASVLDSRKLLRR